LQEWQEVEGITSTEGCLKALKNIADECRDGKCGYAHGNHLRMQSRLLVRAFEKATSYWGIVDVMAVADEYKNTEVCQLAWMKAPELKALEEFQGVSLDEENRGLYTSWRHTSNSETLKEALREMENFIARTWYWRIVPLVESEDDFNAIRRLFGKGGIFGEKTTMGYMRYGYLYSITMRSLLRQGLKVGVDREFLWKLAEETINGEEIQLLLLE
jgi:hypothetical protein